VINGTNLLGKDNPRWLIGNAAETIEVADAVLPVLRGPAPRTSAGIRPASAVGDKLRTAGAIGIAWLIGLPRRVGNWLFALNDAEAGWRGWQVTEQKSGLVRHYRDARFATLGTLLTRATEPSDGVWPS
jgi:hypothetical protein